MQYTETDHTPRHTNKSHDALTLTDVPTFPGRLYTADGYSASRDYYAPHSTFHVTRRPSAPRGAPVRYLDADGYGERVQMSDSERAAWSARAVGEYRADMSALAYVRNSGTNAYSYLAARGALRTFDALDAVIPQTGAQSRKLANNTYAVRVGPDHIAIQLHGTDILVFERVRTPDATWHADRVTLRTGGYLTDTTYRRLLDYAPRGVSVSRWTIPARAVADRGADYARDTDECERVTPPVLNGYGEPLNHIWYEHVDRAARALWTVTTPYGVRLAWTEGLTLYVDYSAL